MSENLFEGTLYFVWTFKGAVAWILSCDNLRTRRKGRKTNSVKHSYFQI